MGISLTSRELSIEWQTMVTRSVKVDSSKGSGEWKVFQQTWPREESIGNSYDLGGVFEIRPSQRSGGFGLR
jgi:hypothetical protein